MKNRIKNIHLSILIAVTLSLLGVLSSCGREGGYSPSPGSNLTGGGSSSSGSKVIFVTAATTNGALGGTAALALVNADVFCDADAVKATLPAPHNSATFKALIANSVREAVPPKAWVLTANTRYVQADGATVIGTTNASRIFTFPVANAFSAQAATPVWVGIWSDWSTYIAFNCHDWTSSTGLEAGPEGVSDSLGVNALIKSTSSHLCSDVLNLYCVEQ